MSKLVFKKDVEPICMTEDFWYMLTSGGYLKPDKYLEPESAKKVKDAIAVLLEFDRGMEENELYEEY